MSDPMEWIAATLLPGLGVATLARLQRAGVAVPALLRGDEAWPDGLRLRQDTRLALLEFQRQGEVYDRASSYLAMANERNWSVLTLGDSTYPSLLRQISDPPPVLWIHGDRDLVSMPQLAIVGSRNASRDGASTAYQFAQTLTRGGLTVTSGLAMGIDAAAHQAAVDLKRPTLAVLGTGLDSVYPRRNQRLAQAVIEQGGAWVSEFVPGTGPLQSNFPRRNRIISGLTVGTWVVEAAPRSGSLITARLALEQGREVFAMPGSVHNPLSRGCHALIREGAHLIETADDILAELGALLGTFALPDPDRAAPEPASCCAVEPQRPRLPAIVDEIPYAPIGFDQLLARVQLSPSELQRQLSRLELDGAIEIRGGLIWRIG